jgi:Tol biopolymer transport system component/tRNA A-37 threonylcarbamoyl transferase component Bud32
MTDRQKQIEGLFQEARDKVASERQAFLDSTCADHELRRAVEELLTQYDRTAPVVSTARDVPTEPYAREEPGTSIIGRSIGRYFVDSFVGRGAMGEVYLAFDQHLPRKIALKVLPAKFTHDSTRLQRFVLEAHAASSLNHPNIITIHEIGYVGDIHFIAAEFVEGETLRARLAKDKLTPIEAVDITIGIAQALVAAHAAGIVHRDIKPENVMIRPDGYLKVLDFGLAKLVERADVRVSPNQVARGVVESEHGVIVGTPRYMSPEQFMGQAADARSDIFSAGVVLYELLTGLPPFTGATPKEVAESILTRDPVPVRTIDSSISEQLEQVVARSIQKSASDRYQTAREFLDALLRVRSQPATVMATAPEASKAGSTEPRGGARVRRAMAASALILLALLLGLITMTSRSCSKDPSSNLSFSEIYSWKCERGEGTIDARFSHDAKTIAFTMLRNNWRGIWLKHLSTSDEPVLVAGDGYNGQWPIWSPDDKSIAFVSDRDGEPGIWIHSIPDGRQTRVLSLDRPGARTRSWSRDGTRIYFESANNLFTLDLASRTATQTTHLESRAPYRHFTVSPDNDRICYADTAGGQQDIWVAQLDGSAARKITNDAQEDRYPLWHPDGNRVLYISKRGGSFQIFIADITGGSPRQVTISPSDHLVSDVSKDGTKLLDVGSRDDADLFSIDPATGSETELTSGSVIDLWPDISPDGKTLAYQSTQSLGSINSSSILVRPSTNSALPTQVAAEGFAPLWAPGSDRLAFYRFREGKVQLFVVEPGSEERLLTANGILINGYNQLPSTMYGNNMAWSPDGRRIAYCSRASGAANIWETGLDGRQAKQVSNNTSATRTVFGPIWSPDSTAVVYVSRASQTQARESISELTIAENGASRVLYSTQAPMRICGWTPSGKSLIVAIAGEEPSSGGYPLKVLLSEVGLDARVQPLTTLESTYFWSVILTTDRKGIGFVSSRDRSDNIWISDSMTASPRKVSSNTEPKVYIPSIVWSHPGRVFFAKQSSLGFINVVENFR